MELDQRIFDDLTHMLMYYQQQTSSSYKMVRPELIDDIIHKLFRGLRRDSGCSSTKMVSTEYCHSSVIHAEASLYHDTDKHGTLRCQCKLIVSSLADILEGVVKFHCALLTDQTIKIKTRSGRDVRTCLNFVLYDDMQIADRFDIAFDAKLDGAFDARDFADVIAFMVSYPYDAA